MTPEFKAGMSSRQINKLEQHQHLQLLDIPKSSTWQHQTTTLGLTYHQTHCSTVTSAASSSHPTCHQ
eukprot:4288-Amphidinium_carterae.1